MLDSITTLLYLDATNNTMFVLGQHSITASVDVLPIWIGTEERGTQFRQHLKHI